MWGSPVTSHPSSGRNVKDSTASYKSCCAAWACGLEHEELSYESSKRRFYESQMLQYGKTYSGNKTVLWQKSEDKVHFISRLSLLYKTSFTVRSYDCSNTSEAPAMFLKLIHLSVLCESTVKTCSGFSIMMSHIVYFIFYCLSEKANRTVWVKNYCIFTAWLRYAEKQP